ncbi:hypothetical protein SNE40_014990 [Patella caerulea]|uniref:Transmembrane protein adipocyte-associated 1 homolog n=1 Tax=Patella caerulea TaxID=87958 RepID=A0AAN8JK34_PATCE
MTASNISSDVLRLAGNNTGDTSSLTPIVTTTVDPNSTFPSFVVEQPFCQWILYDDIANSRVRVWDLIILVPNAVFAIFLLYRLRSAATKLQNSNSPIFKAFYGLVFVVAGISILRCVVAMTVNASVLAGDVADKVIWLVLRFFLLATELSVVTFGLLFGHLESHASIRRVLIVTSLIALAYSCTQGSLEFIHPDPKFRVKIQANGTDNYDIFAHGGMIFWFSSSFFFFVVYSVIFILPWTGIKKRLALPSKTSFYYYCLALAILNLTQAIGSALIYYSVDNGRCVVDITTYLYFTIYDPMVYVTFLREFFSVTQPSILFSYKHQVDDLNEEDTVSMPCHTGYDKDDHYSTSYDSTHFDRQNSLAGSVNHPGVMSVNSDFYQIST